VSGQAKDRDGERERFLRESVRVAARSVETGGGPFGCLVVGEGRVLARASNRVTELGDPTAHAEILAIREACRILGRFQLGGCEVYCSSEPCPMCLGAIYWARPAAVYFANPRAVAAAAGFDDGWMYEELAREPADRSIRMRKLDVEHPAVPFELWREKHDRVEY
jgi:guanine deaminase